MTTITVDSRVHVATDGISASVVEELREVCEHVNPEFAKKRTMGLPTYDTPAVIRTWRNEPDGVSLPSGAMSRVREVLRSAGIAFRVHDKRSDGEIVRRPLKYVGHTLREYQIDMVESAYRTERCVIRAATGCLAGDTIVELNRAGKSFKCELRHLVTMFHGGRAGNKRWEPMISTRIRMRTRAGFIRLGTVRDAYASGTKTTYVVETRGGKRIRATLDHRFLTKTGWKRLGKIAVGEHVHVDIGASRSTLDEIVSIGDERTEETFDVEIAEDEHNFIADGFVVHNSGKTTAAFAFAARTGLNTLVILPSGGLLKQWQHRAAHDLGLRGDAVGIIRAGTRRLRPLTLATQQTLWSRGVDDELMEYFGTIIIDEAHHAAARTFMETIDKFPARYRVAFTADERRKDRKEFIVYDLIGNVAATADRDRCEAVGAVLDVEIRVIPTEFRYEQYAQDSDFNALLAAMTRDEARNKIATDLMLSEIAQGEQVLAFSHRRDHVRDIDRALIEHSIRTGCMLGAQDKGDEQEFDSTREGLLDGSMQAAVGTYSALGEGIDLPAVSVGVAMTPIATNKQLLNQVRGRFCRPSPKTGKTQGRLYMLYDWHVFDQRVLKNIISWNRSVVILIGGTWIDAREYLARERRRIG